MDLFRRRLTDVDVGQSLPVPACHFRVLFHLQMLSGFWVHVFLPPDTEPLSADKWTRSSSAPPVAASRPALSTPSGRPPRFGDWALPPSLFSVATCAAM